MRKIFCSILLLIFAAAFLLSVFYPKRFECSKIENKCVLKQLFVDNEVFDLSQIISAGCTYPKSRRSLWQNVFYVNTEYRDVIKSSDIYSYDMHRIYSTGYCENQVKEFNSYMKSDNAQLKMRQYPHWFNILCFMFLSGILLLCIWGETEEECLKRLGISDINELNSSEFKS